jgi:hypothetical protein
MGRIDREDLSPVPVGQDVLEDHVAELPGCGGSSDDGDGLRPKKGVKGIMLRVARAR